MFQLTVWSLPSLAAVILAGYTLYLVRRSPNVPGVTPMLALCACVILWSGGQLLGTLVTTPALKMFALKVQVPGIAYLTVCWFWFALAYARRRRHVSTPVLVAVSILPTVSMLLALTQRVASARLAVAARRRARRLRRVGRQPGSVADGSRRLRVCAAVRGHRDPRVRTVEFDAVTARRWWRSLQRPRLPPD